MLSISSFIGFLLFDSFIWISLIGLSYWISIITMFWIWGPLKKKNHLDFDTRTSVFDIFFGFGTLPHTVGLFLLDFFHWILLFDFSYWILLVARLLKARGLFATDQQFDAKLHWRLNILRGPPGARGLPTPGCSYANRVGGK